MIENDVIDTIKNRLNSYFRHGLYHYILKDCSSSMNYELKGKYKTIWDNYNAKCYFTSGYTKYCIVWDDLDYVVKIPMLDKKDYCAIELHTYEKAAEIGMEKYFAAEYCIGTIPEFSMLPIYVQEKAMGMGDKISDYLFNSVASDTNKDNFHNEDEYYEDIMDTVDNMSDADRIEIIFRDFYAWSAVSQLIDFCNDNNINDLHSGNIGYNINGDPILVDYSGYFE